MKITGNKVLIIVLIVIAVLAILGGVFAYLFFATDVFKSNQQLFAKYLTQNMNALETIGEFSALDKLDEQLKQNKYEENIKISCSKAGGEELIGQITIDTQNDPINQKNYGIAGLLVNGLEEPLKLEYMRENDIYSLRFTNSVKQFLSIENKNLKQFAQNLGMDQETINQIPDKIDFKEILLEELKLTEDEKQTEINKYLSLVYNCISEEKYTKTKNAVITVNGNTIKTDSYTLTLNMQDLKNIAIALLDTLKQDEIILSRLYKIDEKIQEYSEEESIKDSFIEKIQTLIDELNQAEAVEKTITFTVYQQNKNTVRIKIEETENSITVDTTTVDGKQQIDIKFTSFDEVNEQLSYGITLLKENDNKLNIKFISINGEEQQEATVTAEVVQSENSMKLNITSENKYFEIEFTREVTFMDEISYAVTLDNSNNIILNEETKEKIDKIFNALVPELKEEYIQTLIKSFETYESQNENKENLTVSVDSQYGSENGIIIYEKKENKRSETSLKSEEIEFFSIISESWLPENVNNEGEGSHNGENYIAYTFYVENIGQNTTNYRTTIEIEDVEKNMDEAIRVSVFKNDSKVVYAKNNSLTGNPELGTVPFLNENIVMSELTEKFEAGDIDKYTVVIWLDGNDSDSVDDLIGGTIKMHMTLKEEK